MIFLAKQSIQRNKGFTLVEVIVALFILAVVLASSVRLFNSAIEGEQFVRDKTLANWVAQNYEVELQIQANWPELGEEELEVSMGGVSWIIYAKTITTPDKAFRKTDIQVYKDSKDGDPVTELAAYSSQNTRW